MGKVAVVLHQANRFVIGACAIQLGASQGIFVGDPIVTVHAPTMHRFLEIG